MWYYLYALVLLQKRWKNCPHPLSSILLFVSHNLYRLTNLFWNSYSSMDYIVYEKTRSSLHDFAFWINSGFCWKIQPAGIKNIFQKFLQHLWLWVSNVWCIKNLTKLQKWPFYHHFYSFFCRLHGYLLQKLDSDDHFEVNSMS